MKKEFSLKWKASKSPRKQRKYIANAPLHVKNKFLAAHLSKELIKKYKKRSFTLRKGDTVKVMRGQFKKKTGKVDRIDLRNTKVYIQGVELVKKDGSKSLVPIHPSNLMIQELTLNDKKRIKSLERK